MNIETALSNIYAPKGFTSVITAMFGGDMASIQEQSAVGATLETARAKLKAVTDAQAASQSDAAWWGYMGDIAYWRAAVSILEAAVLVGPSDLPDVPAPSLEGRVVMDACSAVERYGQAVLAAAKDRKAKGG